MKNKGWLVTFILAAVIATFLAISIKSALTPRDLSKEDPRQVFEGFVCSPPPPSLHQVRAKGIIAFAGGNAIIEFQFDPRDHDDIIKVGKFQLAGDKAFLWVKKLQPEGVIGGVVSYVRVNEGMTQTALFVAEDRRRAWFREIQY